MEYKKPKSLESSGGQNNNKPKAREYKFHLHDSVQRKTSEGFGKIKEAIIFKITKIFDLPLEIVESIKLVRKRS